MKNKNMDANEMTLNFHLICVPLVAIKPMVNFCMQCNVICYKGWFGREIFVNVLIPSKTKNVKLEILEDIKV